MTGGWTLLTCYAGLCALFAHSAWRRRRRALGPRAEELDAVELDEHELALLNGGPDLAITSAAVKLRSKLIVQPGRRCTFITSGRLGSDAADLEQELFDAVRRAPGRSAQELLRELSDCAAIRRMAATLNEGGLLQDGSLVSGLRRLRVAGVGLVLLGIGVVVAAIADRASDAVALAAAMTAAAAITTGSLTCTRPRATARGRALLQRLRAQHADLRGSAHHAELALAVALFGGTALWAIDADFASAWGATAQPGMWWSGGGYGYGACGAGGCGGCGGCG